ncbi:hypothetical protein BJ742DRAFT_307482 [Cladochytrium replicatum]|nr:hypothetical protein BJ742DRAFT_307482 [Cladochytrium replicatum]
MLPLPRTTWLLLLFAYVHVSADSLRPQSQGTITLVPSNSDSCLKANFASSTNKDNSTRTTEGCCSNGDRCLVSGYLGSGSGGVLGRNITSAGLLICDGTARCLPQENMNSFSYYNQYLCTSTPSLLTTQGCSTIPTNSSAVNVKINTVALSTAGCRPLNCIIGRHIGGCDSNSTEIALAPMPVAPLSFCLPENSTDVAFAANSAAVLNVPQLITCDGKDQCVANSLYACSCQYGVASTTTQTQTQTSRASSSATSTSSPIPRKPAIGSPVPVNLTLARYRNYQRTTLFSDFASPCNRNASPATSLGISTYSTPYMCCERQTCIFDDLKYPSFQSAAQQLPGPLTCDGQTQCTDRPSDVSYRCRTEQTSQSPSPSSACQSIPQALSEVPLVLSTASPGTTTTGEFTCTIGMGNGDCKNSTYVLSGGLIITTCGVPGSNDSFLPITSKDVPPARLPCDAKPYCYTDTVYVCSCVRALGSSDPSKGVCGTKVGDGQLDSGARAAIVVVVLLVVFAVVGYLAYKFRGKLGKFFKDLDGRLNLDQWSMRVRNTRPELGQATGGGGTGQEEWTDQQGGGTYQGGRTGQGGGTGQGGVTGQGTAPAARGNPESDDPPPPYQQAVHQRMGGEESFA